MADNVGPDGMLHSAASDLGLHCLFMFFLSVYLGYIWLFTCYQHKTGNLKYVKHNGLH